MNYLQINNAATGNGPQIAAAGSDTDVDLNLTAQGSGDVKTASDLSTSGTFSAGTATIKTNGRHNLANSNGSNAVAILTHSSASNPYGMQVEFTGASPDNNTEYFLYCNDSTTARAIIYSDGDLQNHDNSYGAISDQRLKQDIVYSGSQWNDIKNLRIRKYRMKDDVAAYGEDAVVQLGVVAQEVQADGMGGLVKYDEEADVYGVQYSVLYMKAVKALQECMTRVEALEAEVEALKGG